MRILWASNAPWVSSGYGVQTRLLSGAINRLPGHDVVLATLYGLAGGELRFDGMRVMPQMYDMYLRDALRAHAASTRCDAIVTLYDVIVWDLEHFGNWPWIPMITIDHDPLSPHIRHLVEGLSYRVAYSKHGHRVLMDAGIESEYLPLVIDLNTMYPICRREAREKLGWPQDQWVVAMVADNKGWPCRKNIANQIQGFAEFRRRHLRETSLYLHTWAGEYRARDGVDVVAVAGHSGLTVGKDIRLPSSYRYTLGYSDSYMRTIYSAADVLLCVSLGEGFGLPILEAQACGTPAIVGDWSAMPELVADGVKIPKSDAMHEWMRLESWYYRAGPGVIADALEQAYRRDLGRSEKAIEFAGQFDYRNVVNHMWSPFLDSVTVLDRSVRNGV